jgi:hypothetical protein
MVTIAHLKSVASNLLLAAEQAEPLLKRLDPERRTGVVMALAALVILGAGMILLVVLGARYVRRVSRQRPPQRGHQPSDWGPRAKKDGG